MSFANTSRTGQSAADFGDPPAEYEALTAAAGVVEFSARTQIELAGPDRKTLLHNLCTNDVNRLKPGDGCEAFLTDVKGKVLGHVGVYCGEESLVLETVPEQGEKIIAHLDRYLIREDVELKDRSEEWSELYLAGAKVDSLLTSLWGAPPPAGPLAHGPAQLAGRSVWVRRCDFTAPSAALISCLREESSSVLDALLSAGARRCGWQALETARIEAGTPWYGVDITDKNFPQEVDRNEQAISFTKGCYLGQETVARIDALGHVNQTLCQLKFSGQQTPEPGLELTASDKVVAHVTSAAYSPRQSAPLALAYVRRGHNSPGTKLESSVGPAEIQARSASE